MVARVYHVGAKTLQQELSLQSMPNSVGQTTGVVHTSDYNKLEKLVSSDHSLT